MNHARILLVEDDGNDIDLMFRALREGNFHAEISVVRDGAEALEFCLGSLGQDDAAPIRTIVLLDLKLPLMSGIEVLRALRESEKWRLVPVIVLTSSGESKDIEESYASGANCYLRKPVDYRAFVDLVCNAVRYWLELAEVVPFHGDVPWESHSIR